MHPESTAPGTGPLRNGNPRGNPNLAPRCGAKARSGCSCRAPAMENGRCRMHGGIASGARTEEGRARIRAATTKHGFYSAEGLAAWRRTSDFIADTRALLDSLRRGDVAAEAAAAARLRLIENGAALRPAGSACGNTPCTVKKVAP